MRTKATVLLILSVVLLAASGCRQVAHSTAITPTSAYSQALARAKVSGKPVLLDFTGSDWCSWCIKFDHEVLDQAAFKDYASRNLDLLVVDFPHDKPLPAAEAEVNDQLSAKYGVEGFPTFVLVDGDGKVLGKVVGYMPGGPSAFIAKLDEFRGHVNP